MRILSPLFVREWKGRLLNIHPSLLPKYPGAHAHRDALADGAKVTGCTVHLVDEGVDSGPILAQRELEVLPDDDEESRKIQGERIKKLSNWIVENEKSFLLEFLVPATEEQLAMVDGEQSRYDSEIRPGLAVKVVEEMREKGADPDIWKIEGLEKTEDCKKVASAIRDGGREEVIAVVLGRGADDQKVNEWLKAGASVEGYKGFAIGRSIFWDSLKGWFTEEITREQAVDQISEKYRSFISVYKEAQS